MSITVYTKPDCVQCTATTRALSSARLDYQAIDLTEEPEVLAELKRRGHLQAPVVVTDDDSWSGYRPDKIQQLA